MSLGLRELGSASARHRSESARDESDRRASAAPLCGCCRATRKVAVFQRWGWVPHGLCAPKLTGVKATLRGHP